MIELMMVDVRYIRGCNITSGSGVMHTLTLFDPSKRTLSQCCLLQTFLRLAQMTLGKDPS